MNSSDAPVHTDLVLLGGGHAHVFVLKSFGMRPIPGVRLTLVTKDLDAPYSGMLPGLLAGHYTHEDCHINLVRLARFAGARLIHGAVEGFDRADRRIQIAGRTSIPYDLLSINVGITPDLSKIEGARQHGLAVKPVSEFSQKWHSFEEEFRRGDNKETSVVVIGGGAAGFEIALAAQHRLNQHASAAAQPVKVTLVAGRRLLEQQNARAYKLAIQTLARNRIDCIENNRAKSIGPDRVQLENGESIRASATILATGALAPVWFKTTDLPLDERGYISVRETLQVLRDDDVFAVGDCASIQGHSRPKSGVFAVRQGPALSRNLRARIEGRSLYKHVPQSDFLSILSTGDRTAIASRARFAISGKWVWNWKDYIDRKFIRQFNDVRWMFDVDEGDEPMRCAGCAAKVGPATLSSVLHRLAASDGKHPANRVPTDHDDAVIVDPGGDHLTLETVDFFKAFWNDPYLLGQISANHALSDIYAMGGEPTRALALAMLPHARPSKVEEDLFQLMAGARNVFEKEDVQLAGGHSAEGSELAIGFFVSGNVDRKHLLRSGNVQANDYLILTKPIGTGIILAAEMQGKASSGAVATMVQSMLRSNRAAMQTLQQYGVHAATDITGFGLARHLLEMLGESNFGATIQCEAIPRLPTVDQLVSAGIASTALAQNAEGCGYQAVRKQQATLNSLERTLLFDPQTSGGLLASVSSDTGRECVAELQRGPAPDARIIGRIQDHTDDSAVRVRITD